jgi:CYTH domain-containing protein
MVLLNPLPRYSILEVERRWLVDPTVVGELANAPYRLFEDLYVDGSRLRLRKITEPNGNALYKFGRKYGKRSPLSEPITTLYLTEEEYRRLACLPGITASKHRYAIAGGSLDVYQRPRYGLMIFELEFKDEATAERYQPPHFVTREITGDSTFSGFSLAQADAA